MNELKPCPFCGEKNLILIVNDYLTDSYFVRCQNCGCQTAFDGSMRIPEREAVKAWNRRSEVKEDAEIH